MNDDADVAYPMRDEAFEDVISLSHHILESSNAFHILSIRDFPGQSRVRFGILLTMFEELGKLLVLVQECEKAAKADYMSVRIDGFNDHEMHGKRAVAQVLEELRTVELASASLIKRSPKCPPSSSPEPAFAKMDIGPLRDSMFYMSLAKKDIEGAIPSSDIMNKYAEIIERNSIAAAEYAHDLGRALGIWIELDLKPKKISEDSHIVIYS